MCCLNDGWSALHYGWTVLVVFCKVQFEKDRPFIPPAAANDSALAAEVLVNYDINLKVRTESTNETALETPNDSVPILLRSCCTKSRIANHSMPFQPD